MNRSGAPRLLILVVTYNAASTLTKVLERIPEDIAGTDYRILILDDASSDETYDVGVQISHGNNNVEILVNPVNQGYGGNQKIGYRYAVDHGFEVVALLHGDGQYAPEKLEELVLPILRGEADAVLGTRMTRPMRALAGGMPLYKLGGNRILTWIQNRLLKTSLSEFHSGYRAYSVAALAAVPFELNTNDFHFDTEIIIQFLRGGLRISEIEIPTYYGDEICHVNGLVYAANVVKSTLASRLHDFGILYRRNYDLCDESEIYSLKLGYTSSHTLALAKISAGARVLDIGCGRGLLAKELAGKGCVVHGIDRIDWSIPEEMEHFICADLDTTELDLEAGAYDVVLLLDIIEHLHSPEDFLDRLRKGLGTSNPKILISVPNVAFLPIRIRLLFGDFEYGREGILDLTHRRLFTWRSLRRMLRQYGYRILEVKGVPAPFPKALGDTIAARLLLAVNRFLIRLSRGLFSYQILVTTEALPTVSELLRRTKQSCESKRKNQEHHTEAGEGSRMSLRSRAGECGF